MSLHSDKYDKMDIILETIRDYTVKHFADESKPHGINPLQEDVYTEGSADVEFVQKLDEFIEHHSDEEIDWLQL